MAYSNSPQVSTYKTVPVRFDGQDYFRTGNLAIERDIQIVNMYYSRITQENKVRETALKKRPGLTNSSYSLDKAVSTDPIRGSFYDVDQNAFYWVVGDVVKKLLPDVGTTVVDLQTLNTFTGYVGFCSFLKADGTRLVCFTDGTDLWVEDYVAVTVTQVVAPDLPSPHQPYPIYIDGYLFLIKTDTGDIYNSNLDDPELWTAGDFITAEISSDHLIRLVKAKNYIVALGYNSLEYFYNGANETGSPLSRNDSPFRAVGLVTGLKTIGDTTFFVGQDNEQNISVFSLNSFKVDRVSNEVVDRTLQTFNSTSNSKGNVYLYRDGYSISVDGKNFYVLVTTQTTWVYDIDDKFWYEWKGSDDTGLKVEAVWSMFNGGVYLAIDDRETISILSQTVYQDFATNFTTRYTTEEITADTMNWKHCYRIYVYGDMHNYTGTSNIQVTWSDNDWGDGGSTISRDVNMFSSSPYIMRCGRFRNRSIRLEYSDNYPLRLKGLELDLNVMGN